MTILPDAAAGVLLALSFALLWQRRVAGVLVVVALQGLLVAVMAAGQEAWSLALVELGWGAVGLPWLLSRAGGAAGLPWLLSRGSLPPTGGACGLPPQAEGAHGLSPFTGGEATPDPIGRGAAVRDAMHAPPAARAGIPTAPSTAHGGVRDAPFAARVGMPAAPFAVRVGMPTARFIGVGSPGGLVAGAVLAAAALPLGVIGPGLAVVLLGALFVASRPSGAMTVAGAASLQAGAAMAGLACGGGVGLLVAPLLPAVLLGWAWCRDALPAEASFSFPSGPASPQPASPQSASPQSASPQPASPQPASPQPASPQPASLPQSLPASPPWPTPEGQPGPTATDWSASPAIPGGSGEAGGATTDRPPVSTRPSALRSRLAMGDFAGCILLALLAGALPWIGVPPGPWRLDPAGLLAAILVSLVVAALRWSEHDGGFPSSWSGHDGSVPLGPARPAACLPSPWSRRGETIPFGGCLTTLGALLAVLAGSPALAWVGLAIASTGALAAAPARHRRLAGIGLGFALAGSLTLPAEPLPATAALLIGLGCLGTLAPALAALAVLLLLRLRGGIPAVTDLHELAPRLDTLLLAAGLLALLVAVAGLATSGPNRRTPALATLGQAGAALVALGIDTPDARFAAVLQVILLVLARLALDISRARDLSGALAVASLAGLPGLFPSLALLLAATASAEPALLPPLGAGLITLGWLLLRELPPGPYRMRPDLAWLPLAALLLLGFAVPGPLGAGLHLVAEQLP